MSLEPDARQHETNNFDALRLVAALMVVLGHAYVLSGRGAAEPLAAHTGLGGLGELGVSIFFVISGYLVAQSWSRRARLRPYLASRLLRILPGLAVATVLTAFLLGPLVTRLPISAYLADATTWLYPLRNVLLYPVAYALPGVFEANPYPGAVNGSLWTLRLEFSCYLLLPALAFAGQFSRRGLTGVALVIGLAFVGAALAGSPVPPIAVVGLRNLYLFIAGAALFAWRETALVRSRPPAAIAGLAWLAAGLSPTAGPLVSPLVLPLVVVGLALRPAPVVRRAGRFGDLSYGVYIYAFPVQQALMQAYGPGRLGVAAFFAATLLVILPLAGLSWWWVERPALSLKQRVRRQRAGTVAEAGRSA